MRRKVAIFPALLTLGNLLCGFGAIVSLADAVGGGASEHFQWAAWMILLGMVCDGLDGGVARAVRVVGPFGAQLDSLADLTTFGLAPALLVRNYGLETLGPIRGPFTLDDVLWCVAGVYAVCAALRLARFNAQHAREPSQHDHFRGLPTPAAAGLVATSVLFALWTWPVRPLPAPLRSAQEWVPGVLPFLAVGAAMAMVSTVRYAHLVNALLRAARPFRSLLLIVFVVMLLKLVPRAALLAGFVAYAMSGPVGWGVRRARGMRLPVSDPPPEPEEA